MGENVQVQSPFVMQNFVYGNSLKTQLVCIAVLDPDVANDWARKNGKEGQSIAELSRDVRLNKAVLDSFHELSKKNKFAGFEFVKAVYLEPEQWIPGGAILTPTFKLQSNKAQEIYQKEIDRMY